MVAALDAISAHKGGVSLAPIWQNGEDCYLERKTYNSRVVRVQIISTLSTPAITIMEHSWLHSMQVSPVACNSNNRRSVDTWPACKRSTPRNEEHSVYYTSLLFSLGWMERNVGIIFTTQHRVVFDVFIPRSGSAISPLSENGEHYGLSRPEAFQMVLLLERGTIEIQTFASSAS